MLILPVLAHGATVSWINPDGGRWNAATNWSAGTVPAAADNVLISLPGTYFVTLDVHVTIASLTLGGTSGEQTLTNAGFTLTLNNASTVNSSGVLGVSSGSLAGPGLLTVNGRTIWSGGSWSGVCLIAPAGHFQIMGTVDKTLGGELNNQGTLTWSGTHNVYMAGGHINNMSGGLFEILNNQSFAFYNNAPLISNSGTIRKSGGGTTVFGVPTQNFGTIEVISGAIAHGSGSFFGPGTLLTGPGTNLVHTGTVTFDGAITSENLELGGANLLGTNTFFGSVRWNSGPLDADAQITIATNSVLTITSSANRLLGGQLNNEGTIIWSGTNTIFMAGGHINNLSGGVFEIRNNQSVAHYNASPSIQNWGTIRKNMEGGVTTFGVPIINEGVIDVAGGIIAHGSGSVFGTGTLFKGAGTNLVNTGTVTFDGTIRTENLELGGANIIGTNTLVGTVRWTSGTIRDEARITIDANSVLNITSSIDRSVGGQINNEGTIIWSGTHHIFMAGGHINNLSGGVFEIRNNQSVAFYNGSPGIQNSGTIRKSLEGGVTTFGVPISNTGLLDVQTGIIAYASGSTFSSGTIFAGAGTNLLYTGNVTLDGVVGSENLEIAGATILGLSRLTGMAKWTSGVLERDAQLTVTTNGSLHIAGTLNRTIRGALHNSGQITWTGENTIYMAETGAIQNLEDGIFEIQNDQRINFYNGTPRIYNLGLIRKISTGLTVFEIPISNVGIMETRSGILSYANGSLFQTGTVFTGAGTNAVAAGGVTLDGTIVSENLEFAGATILGTNMLVGSTRWISGVLARDTQLTVATNGSLHIAGTLNRTIQGALYNSGRITWSDENTIYMAEIGTIHNLEDGIFEIQNDQRINFYNGVPRINNLGLIRKASAGLTVFEIPISNSGILEAHTGILAYASGSLFQTGTAFIGAGTNAVASGAVTLDGTIVSENLEFGGATILGTNTLVGEVRWTLGTIERYAQVTVATNGALHIGGTQNRTIQGILNNAGLVRWSGENNLYFSLIATINNLPSGVFDVQNDQLFAYYNGVAAFNNAGRLQKSGGIGTTRFQSSIPVNNSGTVEAQIGTIVFGAYTQADGRLAVTLRSLTNFGHLQFTTPLALDGTLEVNLNGYRPHAGDTFIPITYPSRSGSFASFDLSPEGSWQTNETIYGPTALTLTVLNGRPTLDPITEKSVPEETGLVFTAAATDPDAGQSRTYALIGAPAGASINAQTGAFSWTPTEAQGPSTNHFAVQVTDNGAPPLSHTQNVTVVVTEVNRAPVTTQINTLTIDELIEGQIAVIATDPDLPANRLSFLLVSAPVGATIDAATGSIRWTPNEAQGPSTNVFEVRISDNGSPSLNATNRFTIIVREVNAAPQLLPIGIRTIAELTSLTVTNVATDSDLPVNALSFRLLDPPTGANIQPLTGVISWTPTEAQGPSTNSIKVIVTDNGAPNRSSTNVVTVIVTEVNLAPVLAQIAAQWIVPGETWTYHVSATDADAPTNTLQFILLSGPSNASIDSSGMLAWTPDASQAGSSNHFTIRVNDNGAPNLTASQSFSANVLALPILSLNVSDTGTAFLAWPAIYEKFVLQTRTRFTPSSHWETATNRADLVGTNYVVTNLPLTGQEFFQLAHP